MIPNFKLAPVNIAFLILALAAGAVQGETRVSGEVTGVWQKARSPYTIVGSISVPDGGELVIEPGVRVRSLHGDGLRVFGKLSAVGNEADSIQFLPVGWLPTWEGIRLFDADSGTHLAYCLIRDGDRSHPRASDTTLSGGNVVIMAGNVLIEHSTFEGGYAVTSGGGLAIYRGSPIIRESLFQGNSSLVGGAISCLDSSRPVIENCIFNSNTASLGGGAGFVTAKSAPCFNGCKFIENRVDLVEDGGFGGALYIYNDGDPLIQSCQFNDNLACQGGAIYISGPSCAARILWSDFTGNSTAEFVRRGGAIACMNSAELVMSYCRFISNVASYGGAFYLYDPSRCQANNLLFALNLADRSAGAIYSLDTHGEDTLKLNRCTFVENRQTSENQTAPHIIWSQRMSLSSCIVTGPPPYFSENGVIDIHHSDLQNFMEGEGNREIAHSFFNLNLNWCFLSGDSPAIDSGDEVLPLDPDGSRADRGWLPFPQNAWESLELDSLSFSLTAGEERRIRVRWRNNCGVPFVASPMDAISFQIEQSWNVSAPIGDSELQGAVWSGDGYYISGSGSQNTPMIYRINEAMELSGSFRQPGNPRGEGYCDLGGDDGAVLVGGDSEHLAEFSTDGELGETYNRPEGVYTCQALAADYQFAEGFSEFYVGDSTGTIVRCGNDFRTVETYQTGMNITSLAMRHNSRSLYIIGEIEGNCFLAQLNPVTGTVTILKEFDLPEGYTSGGSDIANGLSPATDQLVGLLKGEGGQDMPDLLYKGDLYTSWIGLVMEPVVLMPGKSAEWEIVVSSTNCPPGDYVGSYQMAVNGYGDPGQRAVGLHIAPNSAAEKTVLPGSYTLTAYPNPFNGQLSIRYTVEKPGFVSVVLLDLSGRQLRRIDDSFRLSGNYVVNAELKQLPSGRYFAGVSLSGLESIIPITCLK